MLSSPTPSLDVHLPLWGPWYACGRWQTPRRASPQASSLLRRFGRRWRGRRWRSSHWSTGCRRHGSDWSSCRSRTRTSAMRSKNNVGWWFMLETNPPLTSLAVFLHYIFMDVQRSQELFSVLQLNSRTAKGYRYLWCQANLKLFFVFNENCSVKDLKINIYSNLNLKCVKGTKLGKNKAFMLTDAFLFIVWKNTWHLEMMTHSPAFTSWVISVRIKTKLCNRSKLLNPSI